MSPNPHIVYRQARPQDHEHIDAIDDSFTTDTIYEVVVGDEGFALRSAVVDPPLVKTFPADADDGDSADAQVEVALHEGKVCGVVDLGVEEWHHRLVIHHIAVVPAYRGLGVGAALMQRACEYGRSRAARTAWLETSNVNVPAIRAYRRMGFAFCGLDTTLYRGTPSEGETALFMSKALDAG